MDKSLRGRQWLVADALTIADFSVGGLVPSIKRMQLPVGQFSEIGRWYDTLAQLPVWQTALAAQDAAREAWQTAKMRAN